MISSQEPMKDMESGKPHTAPLTLAKEDKPAAAASSSPEGGTYVYTYVCILPIYCYIITLWNFVTLKVAIEMTC